MKHILFIDTNRSGSGIETIRLAKEEGYYVTFASFDYQYFLQLGEKLEDSVLGKVDEIITIDTHGDILNLVNEIKKLDKRRKIDGVVAMGDLEVYQAAKVAEELKLPCSSSESVMNARNKFFMREKLHNKGIPQPKFGVVSNADEARELVVRSGIGYPCILKPVDSSSSSGVVLIKNSEEFDEPISKHFEQEKYSRGTVKYPKMLIEEYIEGQLFSVETVGTNQGTIVLGITDRTLSKPPYFVELMAGYPSFPEEKDYIIDIALKSLEAIALEFGPAHIEMVLTKDGPKIIEINPRLIGGMMSTVISKSRNINILLEIIKMYVGDPFNFGESNIKAGAIKFIDAPRCGVLKKIHNIEEARSIKGIYEVSINAIENSVVRLPKQNGDWLGKIIAFGDTLEKAKLSLDDAYKALYFDISEDIKK